MSSHLHVYVGPYVLTGPDADGGPRREEFDRLHSDALADTNFGRRADGFAWIPNHHRDGKPPGTVHVDPRDSSTQQELTARLVDDLKIWFEQAFAPEIATLCRLWPEADVRFGVVAYYL